MTHAFQCFLALQVRAAFCVWLNVQNLPALSGVWTRWGRFSNCRLSSSLTVSATHQGLQRTEDAWVICNCVQCAFAGVLMSSALRLRGGFLVSSVQVMPPCACPVCHDPPRTSSPTFYHAGATAGQVCGSLLTMQIARVVGSSSSGTASSAALSPLILISTALMYVHLRFFISLSSSLSWSQLLWQGQPCRWWLALRLHSAQAQIPSHCNLFLWLSCA